MERFKLSFCEIILLERDIAEVIVNDGVEIDLLMVEEYHAFLIAKMAPHFSLLVNKINSYSYTFEAQLHLATLSQINKMAVLVYNRASDLATKNLASLTRETPWNLEMFSERESALTWLYIKQANEVTS